MEKYTITSVIPEKLEFYANSEDEAMEKFLEYVAFSVTEIEIEEIEKES